jgi:nucleoside-diphosphate-sugar epimerase
MVYGEGDYQHRYYAYLKRIADRRPAILLEEGRARWRTCRGYVENVAAAIALAVTDDRAAGRIYNVADLYAPTEAEHARTLGRLLGWDGEVVVLPADRLPPALREEGINWDQDLTMDTTRIRAELDYAEPIPTEEALRRTAAWELANPPAQLEGFDYDAEDAALNNLQHLGGSVSPDQIP